MTNNPYQAPSSNLTNERANDFDDTHRLSVQGRSGRANYITFTFLYGVAIIVIMILIMLFAGFLFGALFGNNVFIVSMVGIVIGYVYLLSVFIRLQVRRLHDLNLTGWLVLLPLVLGFVSVIIPYRSSIYAGGAASALLLFLSLTQMVFGLFVTFWPGNPEANQYASPPKPPETWSVVIATIVVGLFSLLFVYYLFLLVGVGFDLRALESELSRF